MQTTVRFHMNTGESNLAHNTNENVRAKEKHVKVDPKTGHVMEKWCVNYSSAEEAIADILAKDLEAYNKKTRKSRQMTMDKYIQSVKDDKRGYVHKVRYKKATVHTAIRLKKERKNVFHMR